MKNRYIDISRSKLKLKTFLSFERFREQAAFTSCRQKGKQKFLEYNFIWSQIKDRYIGTFFFFLFHFEDRAFTRYRWRKRRKVNNEMSVCVPLHVQV